MDDSLEGRMLICSPYGEMAHLPLVFHKRFEEGEPPQIWNIQTAIGSAEARDVSVFRYGNVEYTYVNDLKIVPNLIRNVSPPYYSLVAYEANEIRKEGSAGVIASVRAADFFLPQMVIGGGLNSNTISHCARAGILYFADDVAESYHQTGFIFKRSERIPNLTVIKIGGSAFDRERQYMEKRGLERLCKLLANIHQDRGKGKSKRVKRMIVTVGAGQYGDIIKEQLNEYSDNDRIKRRFPRAMARALQSNLEYIHPHFEGLSNLLTTGGFYFINEDTTSKGIPLIGTAPHYVMARDGIPLQDSDTHTLALADFYQAERVIFVKRTDGVYKFCPYRGYPLGTKFNDRNIKNNVLQSWNSSQRDNYRYSTVHVNMLLSNSISREGTGNDGCPDGSQGHIIESSALKYFRDNCKYVKEILVVHLAPEELYHHLGKGVHRHTPTRAKGNPNKNWNDIFEENFRAAFNSQDRSPTFLGLGYSRIVKN